ncbi:MAG: cobalt ECF transporter T component CbiQ [Microcoleus sp. PH2017_40_RAT_O_B]|uniref:cobalt ECF transporter T component CbiQ n=1 Tax=unclassified Microcoleus TaxID=2642155 RepID=UPI001DD8D0EF|nr:MULTISPECIES: cobalt ECF transporter T component CbiQ [unclassified Microcoleus]MCC3571338.1 cobalt ECF transporter T component CbiQ [Microcoleus sp. PH2017_34_RAT_O_A]MCC3608896.1 cobalt ECF transporter T component CbiQ [Microcoleus sp. PH2017_40_RAT_O_B]
MNHQIDSLAYTNRLRGLPPTHKLSFAIALLILSLLSGAIVQLSIALWLAVWIIIYAGIPGKLYLRLLSLPLMFLLTSLPALAINGIELNQIQTMQWDIWQSWGISIGNLYLYVSRTGLYQVSLLFPRTLASTSCMYFILLTVPFTETLQILRKLRFPALLTELLLLMYRFIFSLLAIADELWIAQNSRCGYRTWKLGMRSLGILIGQLLQRTLVNYRQVSLSLASRGFNGELRVWHSSPYKTSRRYTFEAVFGCTVLTLLSVLFQS